MSLRAIMRSLLVISCVAQSRMFFSASAASAALSRSEPLSRSDRIRGAYYGALMSDALTLGSHYEYDAPKIKLAYNGEITKYMAPGEQMGGETHGIGWGKRNYHPGAVAGDQTDYGEYNVLVLEYLATQTSSIQKFDVQKFIPFWQRRLQNWKQWVCTQTKATYQQVSQGTPVSELGGYSNAMALRFAAVFAYYDNEADCVDAARKAMFTHRETSALQGGEFFAKVTYRIIHRGLTPAEAIDEVAAESSDWFQQKVQQAKDKVQEATTGALSHEEFADDLALTSMARLWDVGKTEPIKVGKASPTEGTLPGSLYFILKYSSDLTKAAKANAMVGGDNASRAIAVGMVLGAAHGVGAIPSHLRDTLNHWEHSATLLETMPLLQPKGGGGAKTDL